MEYKALLSLFNVHVDEVRGKYKEELYHELVYSATNGKGEKTCPALKSSLFGKSVGYDALQKRIEKSGEIIKNRRLYDRSGRIIAQTMRSGKTQNSFEKELIKNGISVLFRKNEAGRIYGVTFVNHQQKVVFNGSRLGKAFSANLFHEKFNTSQSAKPELQDKTDSLESKQRHEADNNSSFESVSGILTPGNHGENYEEEEFIRKMKRKNKRRFRL